MRGTLGHTLPGLSVLRVQFQPWCSDASVSGWGHQALWLCLCTQQQRKGGTGFQLSSTALPHAPTGFPSSLFPTPCSAAALW